ncbi:ATP-dependent DNA helicase [Gilliamella sp. B14384H2]|uniref:ATP-dependent DNA helicase n=1 Tax=unclassified Gilliamella TaxID=2685620 RepID=UPI0018DB684F|nr:ATP-dependent DNA helicase [Gilliamella sp. B14384G10]MBI0039351.1 ATP-dependent DNA helicase [Gilliamella sp. B14384G7]MBI0050990.1 ATP-dependent DNA helicase [Gilliamella sp. B14384G13]MBI0053282.1 ATP-dependent DNA helicase [Gilliamella sp. B14384H2]
MIDDFAENGLLATAIDGFVARSPQRQMANKVTKAIQAQQSLVVEAGTGTGKTFAYLVPALRSEKKVIISTGSKNLQEQLYSKDLPIIKKALDYTGKISLLKGRANYLCLERMYHQYAAAGDLDKNLRTDLVRVKNWSIKTKDGDISKCTTVTEDNPIWPILTSTNDNCLGSECEHYNDCYVVKARKRALNADIVVVNHHLFLADVVVKDTGFGELIPKADVMIFDEAHQLPDLACHYFGEQLTSRQLFDLAKEINLAYRTEVKDMSQLQQCADKLQKCTQDLRLLINQQNNKGNLRYLFNQAKIKQELSYLFDALDFCKEVLLLAIGRSTTLDNCFDRVNQYQLLLKRLTETHVSGFSYWYESSYSSFLFALTPLSVAEKFAELLIERKGSWIFTSATLSVDNQLDYFTKRLGLTNSDSLILESPFDYNNQTIMCVPRYIPSPNEQGNAEKLVDILLPVIEANKGRCFFLCTSYAMMNALATQFRELTKLPVLVQGDTSKVKLLEQFIHSGNALLIATSSFWEGIDVRGDILSCVIIDKLPFTSPDEPLIKARMEDCQMQGGDAFNEVQLPEAVITLKQGVGRLIRHHNDRGAIIICDNRLVMRPYGATFINSLPPSPRTRDINKVINFLLSNSESIIDNLENK